MAGRRAYREREGDCMAPARHKEEEISTMKTKCEVAVSKHGQHREAIASLTDELRSRERELLTRSVSAATAVARFRRVAVRGLHARFSSSRALRPLRRLHPGGFARRALPPPGRSW